MFKNFLSQLISGKDDVSSKRVASLFVLINIVILAYIAAIKNGGQLPEYMFDTLALIVGGGLGLTSIEKIFSKQETKKTEQQNVQEGEN